MSDFASPRKSLPISSGPSTGANELEVAIDALDEPFHRLFELAFRLPPKLDALAVDVKLRVLDRLQEIAARVAIIFPALLLTGENNFPRQFGVLSVSASLEILLDFARLFEEHEIVVAIEYDDRSFRRIFPERHLVLLFGRLGNGKDLKRYFSPRWAVDLAVDHAHEGEVEILVAEVLGGVDFFKDDCRDFGDDFGRRNRRL